MTTNSITNTKLIKTMKDSFGLPSQSEIEKVLSMRPNPFNKHVFQLSKTSTKDSTV